MDIRAQEAVGEFDHRIAQVDDGMAWKGLDVAPLGVAAWREDLQATETIEEDCNTAKIGVLAERGAAVVGRLWWCSDEAYLVARNSMHPMKG